MNTKYCYDICIISKAAKEVFLTKNNSVFDAAFDFNLFIKNCFNVCPFKEAHKTETRKENLK